MYEYLYKCKMVEQELKSIVRGREKRTLEYKRAWAEVPNSLYDTICAFLNRDGGVIVLGAENDGSIPQGVNPNTIDSLSYPCYGFHKL